jgi:hypothetical protein
MNNHAQKMSMAEEARMLQLALPNMGPEAQQVAISCLYGRLAKVLDKVELLLLKADILADNAGNCDHPLIACTLNIIDGQLALREIDPSYR